MSVTMALVRSVLDSEEPDYENAKLLGPEALSFLEKLASGADMLLATKAIYLAGLINGELSSAILHRAASNENSVLRVAAASVVRYLHGVDANKLLLELLSDRDVGVQRVAMESLPSNVPNDVLARVEQLAREHTEPEMRKIAIEVLGQRSLARNMGGGNQDMDAGGMGNTIDVAGNGLRMGLPGKGGGMGSPNLRAQTTSNSMGRQRDIINYGTGAGMGQRLAGNTLGSALSWERAALAWEKAAASQESEITRKNGKKSCGCGSAPH